MAINTFDLSTEDNLKYNFFPISNVSVHFKVRTSNDAHVALTIEPEVSDPMYEIIIGGWENTKTVIRKNRTIDRITVNTPNIVSHRQFHGFWVRWNSGHISAGREGISIPFISWTDPETFPIRYVGVCTGWGSTGTWKVDEGPEFNTPNKLEYKFSRIVAGCVELEYRGLHDCHVCLTSEAAESDPMYEFILGGWENTQSALRYSRKSPEKAIVPTQNLVNNNEFTKLIVEWSSGKLLARKGATREVFLEWDDPSPFPITHFGVHSGYGARGDWRITHFYRTGEASQLHVSTEDDLKYQFFPVANGSVQFKIKSVKDAHVALTSTPQELNPMYEIIIGGWGNKKSVIRTDRKDDRVIVETPKILNGKEFRGFWVRWDDGVISAGKEGEVIPFIFWTDPQPILVRFVGLCTGWGATGSWIIKASL